MLAMAGSTGAMLVQSVRGAESESDEYVRGRRMRAGLTVTGDGARFDVGEGVKGGKGDDGGVKGGVDSKGSRMSQLAVQAMGCVVGQDVFSVFLRRVVFGDVCGTELGASF